MGAALFAGAKYRYARDFVAGPFPMSASDLEGITDPGQGPHAYITVAGAKAVDTGIKEITTTTRNGIKQSERVTAGYFAVLVGKRFLIVKSRVRPNDMIQGGLKPMPEQLRRRLVSSYGPGRVQQNILPLLLETEGFRYPGYWAIGIGIVLLFCLYRYLRPAMSVRQDVSRSPVIQRVRKWGDPVSLAVEIENEYRQSVECKSRGFHVTPKYLIQDSFFTFNVLRFQDLLWAYKKVTRHSVNLIPTGKTYEAILVFYGGSATVPGKQAGIDEILKSAREKSPWAFFGFSDELAGAFKHDTQKFCAAVEARRQQLSQKA